jgi:hypothetical protein
MRIDVPRPLLRIAPGLLGAAKTPASRSAVVASTKSGPLLLAGDVIPIEVPRRSTVWEATS